MAQKNLEDTLGRLDMGELLSMSDILSGLAVPKSFPESAQRFVPRSDNPCESCGILPIETEVGLDCWEGCCNWFAQRSVELVRGHYALADRFHCKEYPLQPAEEATV